MPYGHINRYKNKLTRSSIIHDDIFGKRGIEGHNLNFKKTIYNPLLKNYS